METSRVIDKYIIIKKIGSGNFGEVYIASDSNNNLVAAKVESETGRMLLEYKIYKRLFHRGMTHIPKIYNFMVTKECNFMMMELLGPNLEDLFETHKRKFKIETVILLARQLIQLIANLHKARYIHRDIKPSNFLVGTDRAADQLYIMDFGLSKQYMDKNNVHMEYSSNRNLIGTARYASINMHLGIEPSRRCDLVSIGYMLVYFAKGQLPWQGLHKHKQTQFKAIGDMKMKIPDSELCAGLPSCFETVLSYSKKLAFDEEPDYKYLLGLFDGSIVAGYKMEWMQ